MELGGVTIPDKCIPCFKLQPFIKAYGESVINLVSAPATNPDEISALWQARDEARHNLAQAAVITERCEYGAEKGAIYLLGTGLPEYNDPTLIPICNSDLDPPVTE